MPDRTAVETLYAAAETLREITTPLACRILLADPTLSDVLAALLSEVADSAAQDGGIIQDSTSEAAVTVARALLGETA